jgi:iron complex transport system substrate-binding protein
MIKQRRRSGFFVRAIALALATCAVLPAHAQPRPQRIVSMNLCTDELLMRIVDPSRIAGITYLSQQAVNAPLGLGAISAKLAVNHGLAEEVIKLQPDLVLAGSFTTTTSTSLLRHLGYNVVTFDPENTLDDMRANIRKLGALVGEPERAEQVVADFSTRLTALQAQIPPGEKPVFADIGVNNYVSGDATLYAEIVNAGGYRTLGQAVGYAGYRNISLEQVLTVRPALISTATPWTSPPSMSTMALAHPALRTLLSRTPTITIPERYTTCGAPSVLGAVEMLVEARKRGVGTAQ